MIKRIISLFLCTVLLLTLVPTIGLVSASDAAWTDAADAAFDAIDAALAAAALKRADISEAAKTQAAKIAVEKLGYETEERGDGCFTFVADGEPCIFNCHTYEMLSQMTPVEGYVDDGEVVTVNYATRSTGPDAKNVVLLEPFYGLDSSFTKQYQTECSSIAKVTGGTYTLYKTSAATIDAVADGIESGAVVVFDSHGDTDYARGEDYTSKANTSYLLLSTGTGVTSADKSSATGEFGTYYHTLSSSGYYYVDGTAITNHMEKDAPNNLVWMAICLGMATEGLEAPLRSHGVGVVYGYSQSVTFDGDYDYEANFWTNMKSGTDVKTAIAAMKSKYGNWDPGMNCSSLSEARRKYAAFPIVVSDLDVYPGHGNVDNYQTVNSDWELLGTSVKYTVTAASSDTSKGTVSFNGTKITASPKDGYYASGYSVSPKNACTVTQNGNVFTVSDVTADCTVTISFAAREKASLSFVVPNGVSCAAVNGYAGDTVVLPTPEGTPTANRYNYAFVGWTDGKVDNITEEPTVYAAGSSFALKGDTTLYALYSYMASEDGNEMAFTKVTQAQNDYSGCYVIGVDDALFLNASGTVTGTSIGSRKAVVSISDTQIVADSGKLYQVPKALIFEIEKTDSSAKQYTIRMKNSENYLYHTLIGNSLSTTDKADGEGTCWTINVVDGILKVKNASTSKYLQYNSTNGYFRCFADGAYQHVSLYYSADAATYYTTELQLACEHAWSEYETIKPAACTEAGAAKRVCSLCGKIQTEVLPALGHDYTVQTVAPTVAEQGYDLHTCTRCGDSYKDNFTTTVCEHQNTEVRNATPANCTTAGYTGDIYCVDCGILLSAGETLPALGHNFVDGVCTRCGEKDPDYIPPEKDPCEGYTDIDRNQWYHSAVDFVLAKGIMGSTKTDTLTFEPNGTCTRAMIVSILYRLSGSPEVQYEAKFSDVADKQWYSNAIIWASANRIVSGYNSGKFGPNDIVTREQMAVILKGYADFCGKDTSKTVDLGNFIDNDKVTWARNYVAWAVAENLISGKTQNGTVVLDPQGKATRAEAASILMRFIENIIEK